MMIYYNCHCHRRFTCRVLRRHLRLGRAVVWHHVPVGRRAFYGRAYVIPRNSRTPPQVRMRSLFGASPPCAFRIPHREQRGCWRG